jgi:VWFA-related protein
MTARIRVAALLVLVAASALNAGQNPTGGGTEPPTFKVQIDYVEVDVVVADANGNFLRGLKASDFDVAEDGQPQTISTFSIVDIPIDRYEKPLFVSQPIDADVKSNERVFDGRVYGVIIDDLQTAFERTTHLRRAARKFVEEHMGANDLMAVVHTAGPSDANQDFTNNKRLLLAAIDKTLGRKLDVGLEQLREANASRSLDAVRDVAQWLSGVRGRRKTILLFSEGVDYELANPLTHVTLNMREAIAAATRGNVSVFAIDPRGLTPFGDENLAPVGFHPLDEPIPGKGRPNNRALLISQENLREIAEETGGFAAVNANDFSTAFDRIVRENSSYYLLAYYPPTVKPGKAHQITVHVRRPSVTVKARRTYVTPNPRARPAPAGRNEPKPTTATPEVLDALASPIPISGLTIYGFAAPFRGAGQNASVLVGTEVHGRDMALTETDKLVVSYRAIDTQGKIRGGNDQSVRLNAIKPEEKAMFRENGLRFLHRVELPPGRYQLRLAAHDSGNGKVGTVIYDLDVPDFSKGALSLSGIVLTSTAGSRQPTVRADPQLAQVLPGPPIGRRVFSRDDEIALFAEAYDNQGSKDHKVEITATVTTDEGKVLFKKNEVRESSELGGKRGGYGYETRIPLRDLAPGNYVITVSARSTLGQDATVQRQVQFSIGGRG